MKKPTKKLTRRTALDPDMAAFLITALGVLRDLIATGSGPNFTAAQNARFRSALHEFVEQHTQPEFPELLEGAMEALGAEAGADVNSRVLQCLALWLGMEGAKVYGKLCMTPKRRAS